MSCRYKINDRVEVLKGEHKGKKGYINTKRSTLWVIVFDGGGWAQLMVTQFRKIEVVA